MVFVWFLFVLSPFGGGSGFVSLASSLNKNIQSLSKLPTSRILTVSSISDLENLTVNSILSFVPIEVIKRM